MVFHQAAYMVIHGQGLPQPLPECCVGHGPLELLAVHGGCCTPAAGGPPGCMVVVLMVGPADHLLLHGGHWALLLTERAAASLLLSKRGRTGDCFG